MFTINQHQISSIQIDENNNEISRRITRQFSWRQLGLAFIGLGLLVTATALYVVSYGGYEKPPESFSRQVKREAPVIPATGRALADAENGMQSITLNKVFMLASQVGSPRPSTPELERMNQSNEICYSQPCLETAKNLLNSINFSVAPCDDFYQFTCGSWIKNNPIPESQSRWNQFAMLREQVNTLINEILDAKKESTDALPINQAKDYFKLCIDTDMLDNAGLNPLRNQLQIYGDWPILFSSINQEWDPKDFHWLQLVADLRINFEVTAIISIDVGQDVKNTNVNVIYVDQPSLILPRDMLINIDGKFDSQLDAYKEYIKQVVKEFNRAQSNNNQSFVSENILSDQVDEIIQFEKKIAQITIKEEDRTDFERMYNKMALNTLQTETAKINGEIENLDWLKIIGAIFKFSSQIEIHSDEVIIVQEVEYFKNLIPILSETSKQIIANYLQLRMVHVFAGETTVAMRNAKFKFNQALTGVQKPRSRGQECASSAAENGFGMAIGVKYIEKEFDDESKSLVNELVANLTETFNVRLGALANDKDGWMDDETKDRAQRKLAAIKTFMGYPDWLRDKTEVEKFYGNLTLSTESHLSNFEAVIQWRSVKQLGKLRLPTDRDEWLTPPPVVNAFYNPPGNSIIFPAGILQPPFFKKGVPQSLNIGGIGSVIGHEITHGFDNQGRQYDEIGNLNNWWTEPTLKKFKEKAECISNQYDLYSPAEGLFINGNLTLGENIADNGGIRQAYATFISVNEVTPDKRLPGLEQYSPQQLFFLGYARLWCENINPAAIQNQILTDPHSPARFRVIGPLSNTEEFSVDWNCQSDDNMKRCILW